MRYNMRKFLKEKKKRVPRKSKGKNTVRIPRFTLTLMKLEEKLRTCVAGDRIKAELILSMDCLGSQKDSGCGRGTQWYSAWVDLTSVNHTEGWWQLHPDDSPEEMEQ